MWLTTPLLSQKTAAFNTQCVPPGLIGAAQGGRPPGMVADGFCIAARLATAPWPLPVSVGPIARPYQSKCELPATSQSRKRLVSGWRSVVLLLNTSVSVSKTNTGTVRSLRIMVPNGVRTTDCGDDPGGYL